MPAAARRVHGDDGSSRRGGAGPGGRRAAAVGDGHAGGRRAAEAAQINLHDLVLVIITLITLFVAGLLGWVMWRYNARRNPVPSRTAHHTLLEIAWTVIPVLILVIMAIPSFRLIYYEDKPRDADLTVKVTGHQWYWEYSYPDKNNIDFSSYIIPDDQLKPGQLRLLEVDNQLVVPAGKTIRVLQTSTDVIHSWFIPVARRPALCDSGADDRDLVPRRQARRVLRPVQPDLRHQSQPHADRRARRDAGGIRRLAGRGEDQILGCSASDASRHGRMANRACLAAAEFSADPAGRCVKETDDVGNHPRRCPRPS